MAASPRLSLCMIVKDESYFLPRCLEQSRDFVDEIVVVDTGSSDGSQEIAAGFTDKVYSFDWQDDFSKARNYSLEQASGDWIIVLDADEVIAPNDWARIRELIADTERDAFFLTERNYTRQSFEGGYHPVQERIPQSLDFPGYKLHYIARLFRNDPSIRYQGHVHEVIDNCLSEDQYALSDITIHHHGEDSPQRSKEVRQLNYLRLMEQDLASDPSGRLFATAASIRLHFLKDYPKVIEYYEEAISRGWRVEESRENQALAMYMSGDLDGAYRTYKALYDSDHANVNLCINLANLAVKRQEHAFAVTLLERAVALGIVDSQLRISINHNLEYLRREASDT